MKQKGLNVELEIKLKRIIIGRNAPVIIFFEYKSNVLLLLSQGLRGLPLYQNRECRIALYK